MENEKLKLNEESEHIIISLKQSNNDKEQLENKFSSIKIDLQNDIKRIRINNEEIIETKNNTITLLDEKLVICQHDCENK